MLQDVGTIKQPTSGQRLGGSLTGLDTPTLCSVWATPPYLHDGSATSIPAAITAHAAFSTLIPSDLTSLAAYVQQIDATTSPECAPVAPFLPLTFAHSGSAYADASGTSLSVPLTGVKAGSLLVAYVKWEGTAAATLSVSDGTTTFTADAIDTAANNNLSGRFYYLPASARFRYGDVYRDMERGAAVSQVDGVRVQLRRRHGDAGCVEPRDGYVGHA